MTKNKVILILLFIFTFSLKGIALDSSYKNSLEEIDVKKSSGGNYIINLLFDKTYTEPLSLQKKTGNTYSIILPETKISSNDMKVIYKEGKDKIKLDIKEYPYIDPSINNGYVKITATTMGKIPLKVASDVNLSPKVSKISAKNIEIVKKEPIQTSANLPEEKSTKTQPTPTSASTEETFQATSTAPQAETEIPIKKNNLTPDYLDILIKISLVLFILLIVLRQFYKKFKSQKKTIKPKPDYRRKIVGGLESERNREIQSELDIPQQQPKQKSQFEQEIENLNQQAPQETIYEELDEEGELFINEIPIVETLEDEYEDEDFDYDFDFDEEETESYSTPKLLSTVPIDKNKGFYLVKYDGQTALIGYIKDEIFIINKFDKIYNPNLQARLNERKKNKSNYIVRIDNYKALVEVSDKDMNVLIEF